jgi:hypothetical protein
VKRGAALLISNLKSTNVWLIDAFIDKKRQTIDNKDIRPFQGRGTVARQRNGGGFYPREV